MLVYSITMIKKKKNKRREKTMRKERKKEKIFIYKFEQWNGNNIHVYMTRAGRKK